MEADALSRIRWTEEDETTLDQAMIKAIIDMGNTGNAAWAEAYSGMLKIPDIKVRGKPGWQTHITKGDSHGDTTENVPRKLETSTKSRPIGSIHIRINIFERIVHVQGISQGQPSFENHA